MGINNEGYAAIYGTVEFTIIQLVQILHEHSFAMVPEDTYQDWLKKDDFRSESFEDVKCADGITRTCAIVHFESKDHTWDVQTYHCPHPYDQKSNGWRFIDHIKRNDEVVAQSAITVEEFCIILNQKSRPNT